MIADTVVSALRLLWNDEIEFVPKMCISDASYRREYVWGLYTFQILNTL